MISSTMASVSGRIVSSVSGPVLDHRAATPNNLLLDELVIKFIELMPARVSTSLRRWARDHKAAADNLLHPADVEAEPLPTAAAVRSTIPRGRIRGAAAGMNSPPP